MGYQGCLVHRFLACLIPLAFQHVHAILGLHNEGIVNLESFVAFAFQPLRVADCGIDSNPQSAGATDFRFYRESVLQSPQ